MIKDFFGIFKIKPKKYNYWWYGCYSCKLENKCQWHDVGLNLFQWQIYYKFTRFSNYHEIRNKPMSRPIIKITFNILNICHDNQFCWQQPKNMSDTNYSNWTNIPPFFIIVWTFWPSELKFAEKITVFIINRALLFVPDAFSTLANINLIMCSLDFSLYYVLYILVV